MKNNRKPLSLKDLRTFYLGRFSHNLVQSEHIHVVGITLVTTGGNDGQSHSRTCVKYRS